jgi:uncharacterized protein (DUF433 family)
MPPTSFRLIGRGVYSLAEAHRLTGVPAARIRRWTSGYEFDSKGRRKFSPPVVATELSSELGTPALDFADLLEVRFLNAFREYGVSWTAIRIAAQRARDLTGLSHPFSNKRFSTDGRTILLAFVSETGDEHLLDLVRSQYEIERLISRFLQGEIEFDDRDAPRRWWPVSGHRRIVIDPQRAFGAPILAAEGVPTRVLANAVEAEESIELVASLFGVDPVAVAEAVEYESEPSTLR